MNKVSPRLRAPRLPIVRSGRCRGSEQLPRNVASRFGVRQRFHQSNHRHREINQSIFQFLRSHRSKSTIQNQQSSIVNPSSIFNVRSPSLQGALPRREWPVARQKIGDWREISSFENSSFAIHLSPFTPPFDVQSWTFNVQHSSPSYAAKSNGLTTPSPFAPTATCR
jgi:hypothetical protein